MSVVMKSTGGALRVLEGGGRAGGCRVVEKWRVQMYVEGRK
jgi:hypothetical protein